MNVLAQIPHDQLLIELDREQCARSLSTFVRCAWPAIDPAPYVHGWHIDAMAEHLEAVTEGEIKTLVVNVPPRHMKTILLIMWQAWTWTLPKISNRFNLLRGPGVQFLCGAYNTSKAQTDGVKARALIRSPWFQARWGDRVVISPYVDNQQEFQTTARGHRISVGIPESLGKGGAIRILDDAHKTDEVESPTQLEAVLRNYDEIWSTRSNDPTNGAEVLVGQRQAANDIYNHVLDKGGACHLCLPAEFEPRSMVVNSLGWMDPRGCDDETGDQLDEELLALRRGEPLWPERFPLEWLKKQEQGIGPFAYAAQYQQVPAPRGGGIIASDSWRLWEKDVFPAVDLVVVSLDGAFTDKTMNDPSAITVWGRFRQPDVREPQFIMLWAWQGRLMFNDLMERVAAACTGDWRDDISGKPIDDLQRKAAADVLLIENKANGANVAQEIVRLYGRRKWRTMLVTPKGDKASRLIAVQGLFSGMRRRDGSYAPGQIWAPDLLWSQMVITQVSNFPRAGRDDLVDTVSQALWWMRDQGVVRTEEEAEEEWLDKNTYRKPPRALYPCAGSVRSA